VVCRGKCRWKGKHRRQLEKCKKRSIGGGVWGVGEA